jgi:hypothetical protein
MLGAERIELRNVFYAEELLQTNISLIDRTLQLIRAEPIKIAIAIHIGIQLDGLTERSSLPNKDL